MTMFILSRAEEIADQCAANGGSPISIKATQLAAELSDCETEIIQQKNDFGVSFIQRILYRGEWLKVGKTDLRDDVGIAGFSSPDESALTIKNMLESGRYYGARISDGTLYLIKTLTDG